MGIAIAAHVPHPHILWIEYEEHWDDRLCQGWDRLGCIPILSFAFTFVSIVMHLKEQLFFEKHIPHTSICDAALLVSIPSDLIPCTWLGF